MLTSLTLRLFSGTLSDMYDQSLAYYVAAGSAGIAVVCLIILRIKDHSRHEKTEEDIEE